MARPVAAFVAVAALLGAALAAAAEDTAASPYAGLETREIKALSPERVEGLRTGAGLGYAMAAELNGHPGPKHVLELADELALTPPQRDAVRAAFERMRDDAVEIGGRIVEAEATLDRRFAHRHLDEATLESLTAQIAELEGRLRFVHLRAHLETDAILAPVQRERYVELRGYAGAGDGAGGHAHHPGHG